MNQPKNITSPFKFLDAFELKDKANFFGRDKEIEALYDSVNKNRLVMVYGLSGTGKTSLVQCGLAARFDVTDWYPIWVRRGDNINTSFRKELKKIAKKRAKEKLIDTLKVLNQKYLRPIYLIFDQFEELLILGDEEKVEQIQFIQSIKEILAEEELSCHIIFILREEYLARLYHFEQSIPELFDRRLRVEPMSTEKIKLVLQQSFSKFNITLELPEEDRLQEIVDNISEERSNSQFQLPYLQMYLDLFYQEDYQRTYGDRPRANEEYPPLEFTKEEIIEFGEINSTLEKFFLRQELAIQEVLTKQFPKLPKKIVRKILDIFVSQEGTKRPLIYTQEARQITLDTQGQNLDAAINPNVLTACIRELHNSRLIRMNEGIIELAHDSLASLIDEGRDEEQKTLNNIKKQLDGAYLGYQRDGVFMTEQQFLGMSFYFKHKNLSLNKELQQYIDENKIYITNEKLAKQKKQEEQLEKEQGLKKQAEDKAAQAKKLTVLAVIFSIAAIIFGVVSFRNLDKFKTSFANNLLLKAEKALEKEDLRLAWRLTQEALKKDENNPKAIAFNETLPNYFSQYLLAGLSYNLSPDSSLFSFITKGTEGGTDSLHLLELGKKRPITYANFINKMDGNLTSYQYSFDSKYLSFYTKGYDSKSDTLNVMNLDTRQMSSFSNCSLDSSNYAFSFVDSLSKFLIFFSKAKNGAYTTLNVSELGKGITQTFPNSLNYNYKIKGNYLIFYVKESKGNYTLNVLELGKEKALSFQKIRNSNFTTNGKFLVFFTKDLKGRYTTLNLLELGKEKPIRFRKSTNNRYRISDKYLGYFTEGANGLYTTMNVLELGKKIPISFPKYSTLEFHFNNKYLNFLTNGNEGAYNSLNILELGKESLISFDNCIDFKYSSDNKFLIFYTRKELIKKNISLNILEIGKRKPIIFQDCGGNMTTKYSFNNKYLSFYTKGVDENFSVINILELGRDVPISFPNCFKIANDFDRYSYDDKYIRFYTKGKDGEYTTLNILELGKKNPQSFENSYNDAMSFRYSPDSKYLNFNTMKSEKQSDTLNVLELGKEIPQYFYDCYKDIYSPDSKYLAFSTKGADGKFSTLNVLELSTKKILLKILHQFEIDRIDYVKKDIFITTSTHPITKTKIYKIIDLSLGDKGQRFKYYNEELYAPLSQEEKNRYGIID